MSSASPEQAPPRSPQEYLGLAGAGAVVAGAGIPLVIWLVEHMHLPWWAHIPLAGLGLTAIAAGSLFAGGALCEYRLARRRQGAA